ncbi:PepSY domain-containing protein [Streptomyces sp. LX-29]|uniref:PepSY domain-containing protein n=1 Tax=Streptomyces sp. LX-29 TaxID=2900152 RepID=UPI00240E5983|nr:PepSY domain-containing protein [Streptomyces sp. LX-29]WFB07343.1 PepSY domain-containing protein [Streptomyces sp. LX-29]
MKRNIVIAGIVVAVLVGGGTATAFAVAGDDPHVSAPSVTADRDDDRHDDRDDDRREDRDDQREDRAESAEDRAEASAELAALKGARIDAAEAARAAASYGTVTSVDLDDEGARHAWEVEVQGKDRKEHELRVDLKTGKVTQITDAERGDDSDD